MISGPKKRRHLNGDVSFVPMEFNPNNSQLQRAAEVVANRNNTPSAAITIPANMNNVRINTYASQNEALNRTADEEYKRVYNSLLNATYQPLTPEEIEEIKRKNGYYR